MGKMRAPGGAVLFGGGNDLSIRASTGATAGCSHGGGWALLTEPLPLGVFDAGERFLSSHALGSEVFVLGAVGFPDGALGVAYRAFFVGDAVADEHYQIAFDAELIGDVGEMAQGVAAKTGGAIFGVELEEIRRARHINFGVGGFPEGRVEAGVEAVMNGEKIADVVPRLGEYLVVEIDERGAGGALGVEEEIDEVLGLAADDHEGGGFEGLDETARVSDADDVVDPRRGDSGRSGI